MKTTILSLTIAFLLIFVACKSKKTTTSTDSTNSTSAVSTTTSTPTNTNNTNSSTYVSVFAKPTGVKSPVDADLMAIQTTYKDVTMDKLNEGYVIYTMGACVGCHRAVDIYPISVADWKPIIDDMAQKAKITESQKDAVYKYVLAMKATQPK